MVYFRRTPVSPRTVQRSALLPPFFIFLGVRPQPANQVRIGVGKRSTTTNRFPDGLRSVALALSSSVSKSAILIFLSQKHFFSEHQNRTPQLACFQHRLARILPTISEPATR